MLFNSIEFFVFLSATFLLYYLPALRRYQVVILVLASLFFYYSGDHWLTLLLVAVIGINSCLSFLLLQPSPNPTKARVLVIIAISLNVATLCLFKYCGLIASSIEAANIGISHTDTPWIQFLMSVPLPIGISFYCFEGISLGSDCFMGRFSQITSGLQHLRNTALFIAFFPHLIAGPILRAASFFPQIKPKALSGIDWYFCFKWCVLGFFFKVFVADNLAQFTAQLRYPWFYSFGSVKCISLLLAYSMQFFADFAGYSLIALGLAGLFGYSIPLNFNAPFLSKSMTEFWHRWHISLSQWIRDYLYVPLGGSRGHWLRASFNLILVMTISGLWHGAQWKFALWGMVHGLVLILEHLFSKMTKLPDTGLIANLRMVATFIFFSLSLVVFRLGDDLEISRLAQYVIQPDSILPFQPDLEMLPILLYASPIFFWHFYCWLVENKPNSKVTNLLQSEAIKVLALTIMISLSLVNSGPSHVFIYFQF